MFSLLITCIFLLNTKVYTNIINFIYGIIAINDLFNKNNVFVHKTENVQRNCYVMYFLSCMFLFSSLT